MVFRPIFEWRAVPRLERLRATFCKSGSAAISCALAIMRELEQAARDELAGRPLSPEVMRSLRTVPARLKIATRLPPAAAEKLLGKADGEMSLVADVHTNANDAQVLQQAVGRPLALTVTLPQAEGLKTFHGAAFSYYEFKHPMNDRLTDEAWQAMLADPNKRPALPTWHPAGSR